VGPTVKVASSSKQETIRLAVWADRFLIALSGPGNGGNGAKPAKITAPPFFAEKINLSKFFRPRINRCAAFACDRRSLHVEVEVSARQHADNHGDGQHGNEQQSTQHVLRDPRVLLLRLCREQFACGAGVPVLLRLSECDIGLELQQSRNKFRVHAAGLLLALIRQ